MTVVPSTPVAVKGGTGSFTVTGISGTLSASTKNIYVSNLSVSQDGTEATVLFSVSSAAVTDSAVITLTDGAGSTEVTVTLNTWVSELPDANVFDNQQVINGNLSILKSEIDNLQLLITVNLGTQVAGIVSTLATLSKALADLRAITLAIEGGTVNVIG